MNDKPQFFVKMTRALEPPQNDYVIAGEGNPSLMMDTTSVSMKSIAVGSLSRTATKLDIY